MMWVSLAGLQAKDTGELRQILGQGGVREAYKTLIKSVPKTDKAGVRKIAAEMAAFFVRGNARDENARRAARLRRARAGQQPT